MFDGNEFIKFTTSKDLISKQTIREHVWTYLEEKNIAEFPRPVYNRIPNFKGAARACARINDLEPFNLAKTVKINPDKPQEQARFLTLESGKTLLVPTPRLRTGLFNKIVPPFPITKNILHKCSTRQGVDQFSVPIPLKEKISVDLIVIGSVAVSRKGLRIGKGEGFADLEYAMMRSLGAISAETEIISTVHDCQVFDELPEHLFGKHDVRVDWILTPLQVIKCEGDSKSNPEGIFWELLSSEKIKNIPILNKFRDL